MSKSFFSRFVQISASTVLLAIVLLQPGVAMATAAEAECSGSAHLRAEAESLGARTRDTLLAKYGRAAVPSHLRAEFARLVFVAGMDPRRMVLMGVNHPRPLGYAAVSGELLISSFFWKEGTPFTQEETIAVIAHELSHLRRDDLGRTICAFSALAGAQEPTYAQVQEGLAKRMAAESAVTETVRKHNHDREYDADRGARELLVAMGYDEQAMFRAINKLALLIDSEESVTHPAMSERAARALKPLSPEPGPHKPY